MTDISDVVRPYRVTRQKKILGIVRTKPVTWETDLLLSDAYFARTPQKGPRRAYARKALLVVLESSAPFSSGLKWSELKIEDPAMAGSM